MSTKILRIISLYILFLNKCAYTIYLKVIANFSAAGMGVFTLFESCFVRSNSTKDNMNLNWL